MSTPEPDYREQIVTILPAVGPSCAGTKVLLPDGSELPKVTAIVLRAQVGDLWRAEIHCMVRVQGPLTAIAEITEVEQEEIQPSPYAIASGPLPPALQAHIDRLGTKIQQNGSVWLSRNPPGTPT